MDKFDELSGPDFDDRMRADPRAEFRAAVLLRLRQMREACATARRQLQDREAFRRLKAVSSAVDAALSAMELMQECADTPQEPKPGVRYSLADTGTARVDT